jgi:hypothetical protein
MAGGVVHVAEGTVPASEELFMFTVRLFLLLNQEDL